jgi:hypothetical protein
VREKYDKLEETKEELQKKLGQQQEPVGYWTEKVVNWLVAQLFAIWKEE